MRGKRLRIATVASALWVAGGLALLFFRWDDASGMRPNEWGDFFAGLFATLAFFWLVVGYFQQGEELRLSTEALRLQAKELQNSVEQQKALVDASLRHLADIQAARQAQTYAKLTADFSSTTTGRHMEQVSTWLSSLSTSPSSGVHSSLRIAHAYLLYLRALDERGVNTKDDPLEESRRKLKNWFLDCLREFRIGNLLEEQLLALLTKDRSRIMTSVFVITRAQTFHWQTTKAKLPPQERGCSDDPDFLILEQLVADKYGLPAPQPCGSLESELETYVPTD